MRAKILSFLLLVLIAAGTFGALHYAHALELTYPDLPGFGILTDSTNTIPQIFQFFFAFALWIAGILLFGNILYAGFQYMTSGTNPGKRSGAITRFAGVIFGAGILFSTFLILRTINPQLISPQNLTFNICAQSGANCSLTLPTVRCTPTDPQGYRCPANLTCNNGTCGTPSAPGGGGIPACTDCGAINGQCCNSTSVTCTLAGSTDGGHCTAGLTCQNGTCQSTSTCSCGGSGQACCSGTVVGTCPAVCQSGLTCQSGTCTTQATTTQVTFFCQGDSRWYTNPYGGETIGSNGCGPTSLAMILSVFTNKGCGGKDCKPDTVAAMIDAGQIAGASSSSAGTGFPNIKLLAQQFGLTENDLSTSATGQIDSATLTHYLSSGALVLGSSDSFPCVNVTTPGTCPHLFVVDEIVGNKFRVRDPNNCDYNETYPPSLEGNYPPQLGARGPQLYSFTEFPWKFAYVFQK